MSIEGERRLRREEAKQVAMKRHIARWRALLVAGGPDCQCAACRLRRLLVQRGVMPAHDSASVPHPTATH